MSREETNGDGTSTNGHGSQTNGHGLQTVMSTVRTHLVPGKVALVTGASRGIGREIALELARRGASIIVNYATNASAADRVVSEIEKLGVRAIAIQANVSQPAEIVTLFDEAVARLGRVDIVISNAGIQSSGHISEITPADFDREFAVNTRGQLFVAQQSYKHLPEGGRLILTSSTAAQAQTVKNHSIYAGSKAAVEVFARHLANDFADKKVTVNTVVPGAIKSDMYAEQARAYIPSGEKLPQAKVDEMVTSMCPLGRLGEPPDVARVVAFLCSEDGAWMNGKVVTVDGGAAM